MNRHAVKQPAAIAVSPRGDPGAPSSRRVRAALRESSARPGASALAGTPAARILEELDVVVRKSRRRSVLGRMLQRVSSPVAKLWSSIVPEPPPQQSDPSPEIWFPWFFL
jgi:hypothetical protein